MDVKLFIAFLLIVHLIIAWRTHIFILKSRKLNESQKSLNLLLNWSIPIVWSIIVRMILKETKIKVMTKKNRRRKSSSNSNGWDSSLGDGGFDSFGGDGSF